MSETAEAVVEAPSHQPRPGVTVVTPDNFDAFVKDTLPQKPEESVEESTEAKTDDAEAEAKGDDDQPKKKNGIQERISEITAKRKEAEERAEKLAAERKAAADRAEKAEREAAELRAKYEPPKTDELGPEPQPSQFSDVGEYAKALKYWTAESVRIENVKKEREEANKRAQEALQASWQKSLEAAKKDIPDFDDVIAKSEVKVSDQVRDAILESEVGAHILHHLAKNPDEAERIGKLTVGRALKEIGKLEDRLSKPAKSDATGETKIAEISKAPPPISPLKGANAPTGNKVDADGNFYGSYEEYKRLRQAGKIK